MHHLGITLAETLIGFLSGVILGIIIAILLWWSKFLAKVSEPFLVVLNSLPKVALRPCYYHMGRSRHAEQLLQWVSQLRCSVMTTKILPDLIIEQKIKILIFLSIMIVIL